MFVMRLMFERVMYYFAGFDLHPEDHGKDTVRWALLGNKIQSFVDEDSGMRAMDQLREGFFHYMTWDDSDAQLVEGYQGKPLELSSWEIQLIDLTDMVIARKFRSILLVDSKLK